MIQRIIRFEELVSDDNNNNNNNNETLSRSTTTSNEDTSENLDFAQKPKSIRAKSPTVIVKVRIKKYRAALRAVETLLQVLIPRVLNCARQILVLTPRRRNMESQHKTKTV